MYLALITMFKMTYFKKQYLMKRLEGNSRKQKPSYLKSITSGFLMFPAIMRSKH